jgi:hypothetical protein
MKKLILFTIIFLLGVICKSQTIYNSNWSIDGSIDFKSNVMDRVIIISDNEISVSSFIGGVETLHLVVNKIINKDWGFDGVCKTYYCTTKEADVINGYQKVIVYIKYNTITMAMFANEISVFIYHFKLKN